MVEQESAVIMPSYVLNIAKNTNSHTFTNFSTFMLNRTHYELTVHIKNKIFTIEEFI